MNERITKSEDLKAPHCLNKSKRDYYFCAISVILIIGAMLTITIVAMNTYKSRQSAILEAEESAKNILRPRISIGKEAGNSNWSVFRSQGPLGGDDIRADEQLTYEFENGWIVRVRGHNVAAILSRGFWIDFLSGTHLVLCIVATIGILAGIILMIRRPRQPKYL